MRTPKQVKDLEKALGQELKQAPLKGISFFLNMLIPSMRLGK